MNEKKYIGDRPLPILKSGEWMDSLAEGKFRVLNDIYESFLQRQNSLVQLCFKRLGMYSFGGYGAGADVEGDAATLKDNPSDSEFAQPKDIKKDGLEKYLMIPVNPDEISVNYEIDTKSHRTVFFSELATLSGLKLRRFKIESFFPYRISSSVKFGTEPIYRPTDYIEWLTDCMNRKEVLAFKAFGELAQPLPEMNCFIEDFETKLRGHGEVSYTLSICEFVDYRKDMESRTFVSDGDTLIVSPKENKRRDGEIGLGDLVYVMKGQIYSDKLKRSPTNIGNFVNSVFLHPPSVVTSKIFTKEGAKDYFSKFGVRKNIKDSTVYNLLSSETLEFLAEMIKSELEVDKSELWMVVGGDYFSKYRGKDFTDVAIGGSIPQLQNYLKEASPQSLSHTIKLRSMKNNRIGWADKDQLKKAEF